MCPQVQPIRRQDIAAVADRLFGSQQHRALRQWLKSDASVDVVAFFILRTTSDNPNARQEDLSLIPFPVDELEIRIQRALERQALRERTRLLERGLRRFLDQCAQGLTERSAQ